MACQVSWIRLETSNQCKVACSKVANKVDGSKVANKVECSKVECSKVKETWVWVVPWE